MIVALMLVPSRAQMPAAQNENSGGSGVGVTVGVIVGVSVGVMVGVAVLVRVAVGVLCLLKIDGIKGAGVRSCPV